MSNVEFHTGDRVVVLTESRFGCHGLIIDKTADSNIFKVRLDMPNPFIDKDEKVVEELFSVEYMMREDQELKTEEQLNEPLIYKYITEGQLMEIGQKAWAEKLNDHIQRILSNYSVGGLSIMDKITREVAGTYVREFGDKYKDKVFTIVQQEAERTEPIPGEEYTLFRDNVAQALMTLAREYITEHKEEMTEVVKPIIEDIAKSCATEHVYNMIAREMKTAFESIMISAVDRFRGDVQSKFKEGERVICLTGEKRGWIGIILHYEIIAGCIVNYTVEFDNEPNMCYGMPEEELKIYVDYKK